ncbi:RAP domain-containing protein, putative [Babesia ovis]|uniref:RAP domain-containing protein, putative n=1 Tax=Babesia ovis TaxID=5869 RepID=A0A9W5T8I3_BABOV|nr:RAP domain-containing protein, putative [Babesia ovis]
MFLTAPLIAGQRIAARIYDPGTKNSLKVYHLQEYARFRAGMYPSTTPGDSTSPRRRTRCDGSRDVPFFRKIEDWQQLVAEVDEVVRQLSPTQLLATAIAYWRLGRVGRAEWKRLCSAAARHAYSPHANITGISASEVSLILCCFARVYNKPVHSSSSLLRWLIRDVGQLNERDVCMALFYMRRMRCLPPKLETTENHASAAMLRAIILGLAPEGGNKLPRFSPGGLVCLVSNLAYIGHFPWNIIYYSCNVIRKRASELDAKTMAMHCRSLAMLKLPEKGTLKAFATLITGKRKLDTATITCVLHSYAKLRFRPRNNFTGLLEHVHKGIFMFQDHEVAQIAFAMGQLGYRVPDVYESIFEFLQRRSDYQNPQNIAMLMQSFAKVGIYRPQVVDLLMIQAKNSIAAFTLSQSIAVLDACTLLGHFDPIIYNDMLANITKLAEDNPSDATVNQLNRIMYCIRHEHPEFLCNAPRTTQTLIGLYQGHFLEATPSEPRHALYECLEEMDVTYERSAMVGPYRLDALINGVFALDMLSEASLCPITREYLGSVRLKNRHLETMGYRPVHLVMREWLRKSHEERITSLKGVLIL